MSRIWKETGFVDDDPWIVQDDGPNEQRPDKRAIVALSTFLEAVETVSESDVPTAVLLSPAEDVGLIEPHLHRLALVALTFPAFSDGRAFSQATLLRSRLGYEGEIRATGDVLIDQIPLMLRCGINSFDVGNPVALKRLADGHLNGIPLHYQPAVRRSSDAGGYAWRRMAVQGK